MNAKSREESQSDSFRLMNAKATSSHANKATGVGRPRSVSMLGKTGESDKKRSAVIQSPTTTKRPRIIDVGVQVTRTLSSGPRSSKATPMPTATEPATELDRLESYARKMDDYITKYNKPRREVLNTPEYKSATTQEEQDRQFEEFLSSNLQDAKFLKFAAEFEKRYRRIGLEPHRE